MKMILTAVVMVLLLHFAQARDPFLLITAANRGNDVGTIFRMDPKTYDKRAISFSETLKYPFAVTFDPIKDMIYWGENSSSLVRIRRSTIDGTHVQTVGDFETNAFIGGLAVDSSARLIFYTKVNSPAIGQLTIPSSGDTYSNEIIIDENINDPLPITLNTVDRVMFWGDIGGTPRIERANYDGSDRRVVISSGLASINGLALDVSMDELYWVDGSTDKIEKSNMDGNFRRALFVADSSYHFVGLVLFQHSLYISDWGTHKAQTGVSHMVRMNLDDTTHAPFVIDSTTLRFNNIHVNSGSPNSLANGKRAWSAVLVAFVVIANIIG